MNQNQKRTFCPKCSLEMTRKVSQQYRKRYPIEWECIHCGLTTFQPAQEVWLTFKEYDSKLLRGA